MQVSSSRLEVVLAEDHHADLLAEFFRQVWDPNADAASVRAAREAEARHNVAEPGVAPPTWIAVQDGRALGHVTTIPIRLWDGSGEYPAYWIKGLMVLPEFRGGPIGYMVLKAAAAHLKLSGGLAVADPARRLFQALGYRDLGAVPNWIRPLAPQRILASLDLDGLGLAERLPSWALSAVKLGRRGPIAAFVGHGAGTALRLTAAVARMPSANLQTSTLVPSTAGAELDALWRSTRQNYRSCVVRDASYLTWRYPADSDGAYCWIGARRNGTLVGVAVLRRPREHGDERLKGIRLATIADLVYPPADKTVGMALLGAAERAARGFGADAILVTSPAPALGRLLRRQWYLPMGGNVHFLFRNKEEGPAFAQPLEQWWLTRGDGEADEAF